MSKTKVSPLSLFGKHERSADYKLFNKVTFYTNAAFVGLSAVVISLALCASGAILPAMIVLGITALLGFAAKFFINDELSDDAESSIDQLSSNFPI